MIITGVFPFLNTTMDLNLLPTDDDALLNGRETKILYKADGTVARQVVLHEDGAVTDQTKHAIEPHLEYAKYLRETHPTQKVAGNHAGWKEVAYVPPWVLEQAMREGRMDDKEWWKKWLNDADNKAFRITNGRISGLEGL